MRFTELISESRGLANRKMADVHGFGDIFTKDGHKIEMKNMYYFPDVGYYENDPQGEVEEPKSGKEKAVSAVQEFINQNNLTNVSFVNSPRNAAALAAFTDEKNNPYFFVKYFNKINPSFPKVKWLNPQFSQDSGGYTLQTASSQSEQLTIKPTDLVPTDGLLTLEQLIKTIESNANKLDENIRNQVFQLINGVVSGNIEYVEGAAEHGPAYTKYLGEILAPISLITGNLAVGEYEKAGDELLGPGSWNNITHVSFPQSKNNPSVDSIVSNKDGTELVKISSKAGKKGGAASSLNSVMNTYKEKKNEFDPKLLDQYKELIDYMETIVESSIIMGPLLIGQKMGLVDENDTNLIIEYMKNPPQEPVREISNNLNNLLNDDTSKNKSLESIGFRLMATLAKKIIKNMNELNPTPLFTKIFNFQPFVQVNAITRKNGNALAFTEFQVVYPAKFKGKVIFVGKSFYGTSAPKDKIGYKMP